MIPQIGDKSHLSDFILSNSPTNPKSWIDPLGGSFGLFFTINLDKYPDTKFIYNDTNKLNCDIFSSLKYPKFINRVSNTQLTKEIFLNSYEKINSSNRSDRAIAWIMILCSGNLENLMGKEFMGSYKFDILKHKFARYHKYFERMGIHSIDYKKIFKKYDSNESFFFLNPSIQEKELNAKNESILEYHKNLSFSIKSLSGKWSLVINNPDILEIYQSFNIRRKNYNNTEEILVTNY